MAQTQSNPNNSVRRADRLISYLALGLLFLSCLGLLLIDPFQAADFRIVPDSGEYALTAWRFLHEGVYALNIHGQDFPSRFTPWFSILFLTWPMVVFGPDVGNVQYGVLLCALLTLLGAWSIGFHLAKSGEASAGVSGGIFASILLLTLPEFRFLSTQVMSDVPNACIILWICLLFLRAYKKSENTGSAILGIGLLIALATSVRPTGAFLLLPAAVLIFRSSTRIRDAFFILIPSLVVAALNVGYNLKVFGSAFRTGYHYWVSVPYDYLALTFSLTNIVPNLSLWFSQSSIVFPLLALVLLQVLRRRPEAEPYLRIDQREPFFSAQLFLVMCSLPILVFYALYFYSATRFLLPIDALIRVVCGAMLGVAFQRKFGTNRILVSLLIPICVACCLVRSPTQADRRILVGTLSAILPSNAVIISGLDPVYLGHFVERGTQRTSLEVSRNVEYASKVITPTRVESPTPFPLTPFEHRNIGLLRSGSLEAVQFTATENPERIAEFLHEGREVFLETAFTTEDEQKILEAHFKFVPVAPQILKLQARF